MSSSGEQGQLEIAHVLFIDIVGYSKLPINRQSDLLRQLNQIVRASEQFRSAEAADKLTRLPTGDGMALAFFTRPDAPVRCALEVSAALKSYPQLKIRMGINSGAVDAVPDVNDRLNVAGAGINMAQRVMDCGDAGHILLSKRIADNRHTLTGSCRNCRFLAFISSKSFALNQRSLAIDSRKEHCGIAFREPERGKGERLFC